MCYDYVVSMFNGNLYICFGSHPTVLANLVKRLFLDLELGEALMATSGDKINSPLLICLHQLPVINFPSTRRSEWYCLICWRIYGGAI